MTATASPAKFLSRFSRASGLVALCATACFLVFVGPGPSLDAQTPQRAGLPLVQTQYYSPINALVTDSENSLLFSAHQNGSVLVWSYSAQRLGLQTLLRVSVYPILKIAVHPSGLISTIELAPEGLYRLRVWDWKNKRERFTYNFKEQPLFLSFSPLGNYVTCSLARRNSLLFLDAQNGRQIPWLENFTGLVDYFLFSSREERIMTYSSLSGSLSYLQLSNGQELRRLQSPAGLKSFQLLPGSNKTKAIGFLDKTLYAVDLLEGTVLHSVSVPYDILALAGDEGSPNSDFYVFGRQNAKTHFVLWRADEKGLLKSVQDYSPQITGGFGKASFMQGTLLFSDAETGIHAFDGQLRALTENRLLPFQSAAIRDGRLFLSSELGLTEIDSPFFAAAGAGGSPVAGYGSQSERVLTTFQTKKPVFKNLAVGAGNGKTLRFVNSDDSQPSLYAWEEGRGGRILQLDPEKGALLASSSGSSTPLRLVQMSGQTLVSLDNLGLVRVLSADKLQVGYSYNSVGSMSAEAFKQDYVLIGKGAAGAQDNALMLNNSRFGENIGLPSSESVIFRIHGRSGPSQADSNNDEVFSLGIEQRPSGAWTVFRSWNIAARSSQIVHSWPGEDLEAGLFVSKRYKEVFFTSNDAVQKWDGNRLQSLELTDKIPGDLSLGNNVLYSLNRDGSIGLWDRNSLRHLFDLVLFKNGDLLGLSRGDAYVYFGNVRQAELRILDGNTASLVPESAAYLVNAKQNRLPVQF